MEPGSIQHSGYLTPGDEINVQGGFTVHFQKKHRRYWTLQYFGEGNLTLSGYKDEKAFKRSSSSTTKTSTLGRQRKTSSAPVETIRLMTSLKVHKFEMKTKKKVENALIIVNGSHPKFFRPDNNAELDTWHSVFMKFSSDTRSIKRRVRPDKTSRLSPTHQAQDSSDNLERDSGISASFTRSTCESERSSSSSMSSEELNDLSPQRFFPTTVSFDLEDDDHNTSPVPSPTLRAPSGRETSSIVRRSTFYRNSEGIYEEKTSPSSRESTESGFYDSVLHRNEDDRSNSVYDALPQSSPSSPRRVGATTVNSEHLVIPAKHLRKTLHTSSSFDNTDSSIPEEDEKDLVHDVSETLAKRLGVDNSAELQRILNDDGSTHTYMNQRLPFKPASPLLLRGASPPIPARPGNLPRRKSSLAGPTSETNYQQQVLPGGRRRAESVPISLEDSLKYSPRFSQLPVPEVIEPYSEIKALMAEQAGDAIEVHIDKEDLVDSIALVDIRGKVIIAGWKKSLIGKLHVGDNLVQVNDQVVSQAEWANTFIKTSSRSKIVLHVNRLPFAKIINCTRIHEDTLWGFECKANEITHVRPGPATESGLTDKSESSAFSKKSCEWIITEAANKPIRLNCPKDEMMQYLATRNLALPLVVQPKDFIHDLNKALNKLKRSSFYRVG